MKRKRTGTAIDMNDGSSCMNADQPSLECSTGGRTSPRTAVSAKFGYLHLDSADSAHKSENMCNSTALQPLLVVETPAESQQITSGSHNNRSATASSLDEIGDAQMNLSSQYPAIKGVHSQASTISGHAEPPETPLLGPVESRQSKSLAIVSSLSVDMERGYVMPYPEQPRSIQLARFESGTSDILADSATRTTLSSKVDTLSDLSREARSRSCHRITKALKRRHSPPSLTSTRNDLVWSEQEITGHKSDDPNDDGYGINGIGFKPTRAMAEQRKMQRQKQIVEWNKREGNERRTRRRESRREHLAGAGPAACLVEDFTYENSKKVRFADAAESTTQVKSEFH